MIEACTKGLRRVLEIRTGLAWCWTAILAKISHDFTESQARASDPPEQLNEVQACVKEVTPKLEGEALLKNERIGVLEYMRHLVSRNVLFPEELELL